MEKREAKPIETQFVDLNDIYQDERFQVRRQLDEKTIQNYANAYKNEAILPPIVLARIEGVLTLIEGWHRMAACAKAGIRTLEAQILDVKPDEAKWLAATSNIKNGLPLKKAEKKEVFKVYVETKRHYHPNGKLKSTRDMAKDLQIVDHTTIYRWLKSDYPEIAAKMPEKEPTRRKVNFDVQACGEGYFTDSINDALYTLNHVGTSLFSPEKRGELIVELEKVIEKVKKAGDFTIPREKDF